MSPFFVAFYATSLVVSLCIAAWGVHDAYRFDAETWARVRRNRPGWCVAMVVFGMLAVLVYVATVRHDLRDPERLQDPVLADPF